MLKFAIVGFGSRGQCFGKLIGQDKDACLYAVAEPVEKNIEKAVSEFSETARCVVVTYYSLNTGSPFSNCTSKTCAWRSGLFRGSPEMCLSE